MNRTACRRWNAGDRRPPARGVAGRGGGPRGDLDRSKRRHLPPASIPRTYDGIEHLLAGERLDFLDILP